VQRLLALSSAIISVFLIGGAAAPGAIQAGSYDAFLAPAGTCAGDTAVGASAAAEQQTMICLVNYARAKRGVTTLTNSPQLAVAGQLKLAANVRCNTFSHTACGQAFPTVFKQSGYLNGAHRFTVGENLAYGQGDLGSPRATMLAWLNSPPHRTNLFRATYRELGIAYLAAPSFLGYTQVGLWATEFGVRVTGLVPVSGP
jgi:uncharacterized protein YkwD